MENTTITNSASSKQKKPKASSSSTKKGKSKEPVEDTTKLEEPIIDQPTKVEEQQVEQPKLEKSPEVLLNEIFPDEENVSQSSVSGDLSTPSFDGEGLQYEADEYLQKMAQVYQLYQDMNNTELKKLNITLEFIKEYHALSKKIEIASSKNKLNSMDFMSKKNSSAKKVKKNVDTSKMPINKKMKTYPEVLEFLELPPDTQISRAQVIQGINAFVKKEKENKNPDIFVEGNNKCFRFIGKLQKLFVFIRQQMIDKEAFLENDDFPTSTSYSGILGYVKYCLEK